jgi:hypothetical protein
MIGVQAHPRVSNRHRVGQLQSPNCDKKTVTKTLFSFITSSTVDNNVGTSTGITRKSTHEQKYKQQKSTLQLFLVTPCGAPKINSYLATGYGLGPPAA